MNVNLYAEWCLFPWAEEWGLLDNRLNFGGPLASSDMQPHRKILAV
jgi:hypothetical protein